MASEDSIRSSFSFASALEITRIPARSRSARKNRPDLRFHDIPVPFQQAAEGQVPAVHGVEVIVSLVDQYDWPFTRFERRRSHIGLEQRIRFLLSRQGTRQEYRSEQQARPESFRKMGHQVLLYRIIVTIRLMTSRYSFPRSAWKRRFRRSAAGLGAGSACQRICANPREVLSCSSGSARP